MRLLNTVTFKLETFLDEKKPHYAILSHTWGEDEVLFEDIQDTSNERWKQKSGAAKIFGSARMALYGHKGGLEDIFGAFPKWGEPLQYIWIDTCCM
jgi:hypothetical protein